MEPTKRYVSGMEDLTFVSDPCAKLCTIIVNAWKC